MPRICTICTHEKKEEIDKALINNESLRNIAKRFNLSSAAVNRHKVHLPATLTKAKDVQEIAQADNVMGELKRCMTRINLLFDACDRWLRDPDNPEQYDISPRADDVIVVYEEMGNLGKSVRKKAPISQLLEKIEGAKLNVISWESKQSDPRELILKTAGTLQGNIDLLAKLVLQLETIKRIEVLEKNILPEVNKNERRK